MTNLMNRAKDKAKHVELPDTSELRSRIMDAVEEAIDRAESAVHDAPSPKEAAERVKTSRVGEATTAAIAAGLPIVISAVKGRAKGKAARRAAKVAPLAARSHPMLLGAAMVGGVALGLAAMRRRAAMAAKTSSGDAHYELSRDARSELKDDVARMEGEGGDLGAYDAEPKPLRRFVRAVDDAATKAH